MIYGVIREEHDKGKLDILVVGAVDPIDPALTNIPVQEHIPIYHPDNISRALDQHPDIWMDFSTAEGAYKNIPLVADAGVKLLIGTTGFKPEQKKELIKYIQGKVPCIFSSNYAFGVHVARKGIMELAKTLTPEYDIGIVETHHRAKKDAPSGTLDMIKNDIMSVRPDILTETFRTRGLNPRKPGEIDVASLRLGSIPGEHTIRFAGPDEEIVITHRAYSRRPFAVGAVNFARILSSLTEPIVYTENDLPKLLEYLR